MMIQKSGVRSQNSEVRRLRDIVFLITAFIFFVFIGVIGDSFGFWPFTPSKKEVYIARVGDEIITKDEFLDEINKLHKSSRAGKALSDQRSFVMQKFGKFLSELIDNKLMIIEARNLGLDKEADFIMNMDNYVLNLFLDKLRQEEILNKVKVEDKEIEEYYHEQLKKKEEEKRKAQEKADKEKAEKEKTDVVKEGAKKDSDKKEEPPKMSARDREAIRKGFFNIKAKEREKEYFNELRKKAKVKTDNEVLSALSRDKTELFGKDVANVNGESILGIDVLRELNASNSQGEDAKKEVLDKLVLYKLLDHESMNRGYENDEQIKAKIKKYKEPQLIEQFKKKAILPAVKVDENDILGYYKANQEKYRGYDKVNLRMIRLRDEDEAKTILDDLKKGGDFSYLAREKSVDPSSEKGGDIGWVETNQLSDDINKAIQVAKEGDILGPFPETGYAIIEFRGLEKGAYIPFDRVRSEIDTIVGKERFNVALNEYIKRLREIVPIEINQKELDKLQGK